MEAVLCIDLGGTKSAASLVTRDGDIRFRTAAKTPGNAAADDLASFLISLGKTVLAETSERPIGIGVSVGGPTDARRGDDGHPGEFGPGFTASATRPQLHGVPRGDGVQVGQGWTGHRGGW